MEMESKVHCQAVQKMVDMKFLLKAISVNLVLQVKDKLLDMSTDLDFIKCHLKSLWICRQKVELVVQMFPEALTEDSPGQKWPDIFIS
ncbi:hypothetical protein DUI87_07271 [Hirundo rustica rustica]|uniref:Uncharacterized protein n=1 Tax=Hirundo rustica rustica TaxID=333673 RepID=A0A3M0KR54_HIRRU|nr:hypothetical protein DUI87_07271 [Hirundo rustica rustica]